MTYSTGFSHLPVVFNRLDADLRKKKWHTCRFLNRQHKVISFASGRAFLLSTMFLCRNPTKSRILQKHRRTAAIYIRITYSTGMSYCILPSVIILSEMYHLVLIWALQDILIHDTMRLLKSWSTEIFDLFTYKDKVSFLFWIALI